MKNRNVFHFGDIIMDISIIFAWITFHSGTESKMSTYEFESMSYELLWAQCSFRRKCSEIKLFSMFMKHGKWHRMRTRAKEWEFRVIHHSREKSKKRTERKKIDYNGSTTYPRWYAFGERKKKYQMNGVQYFSKCQFTLHFPVKGKMKCIYSTSACFIAQWSGQLSEWKKMNLSKDELFF